MCEGQGQPLDDVIQSYRRLVQAMVTDGGRPTEAADLAYDDLLECADLTNDVRTFLLEWRYDN